MSGKQPDAEHKFAEQVHDTYDSKDFSKHYDPCQEVADKSIRCLHRNPGNKELCNDYFQAYRDCKKAWQEARRNSNRGWFASKK